MTPDERQAAFLAGYNVLVVQFGCFFVPQEVDNLVLHNGALENKPYTTVGVVLSAAWTPPDTEADSSQSPPANEG